MSCGNMRRRLSNLKILMRNYSLLGVLLKISPSLIRKSRRVPEKIHLSQVLNIHNRILVQSLLLILFPQDHSTMIPASLSVITPNSSLRQVSTKLYMGVSNSSNLAYSDLKGFNHSLRSIANNKRMIWIFTKVPISISSIVLPRGCLKSSRSQDRRKIHFHHSILNISLVTSVVNNLIETSNFACLASNPCKWG